MRTGDPSVIAAQIFSIAGTLGVRVLQSGDEPNSFPDLS